VTGRVEGPESMATGATLAMGREGRLDRAGFAVVPRWLVEDTTISGAAKLTYLALSSRIDRQNIAWPSHKRLAAETGTSVSTVQRALRELQDLGVVTWRPRMRDDSGQTSNEYRLTSSPFGPSRGSGQADKGGRSVRPKGPVAATDERTQVELTPMNDSSGLLAGPSAAGLERPSRSPTVKEVVAAFVRRATIRGFEGSEMKSIAGVVGLCVKDARRAGASDLEIESVIAELISQADVEVGFFPVDVLDAFEPLGAERYGGRASPR